MTPIHKDPSYKNRVAIAPYNFVPLPEAILPAPPIPHQDRYEPTLLTGKLACTLTTASPLYVRAARTLAEYNLSEAKPPEDPFYGETKETLLIPGSSLRGLLRNLIEVVSYSRPSQITKKPLFFRTVDVSSIGKAYGKRMTTGDAGKEGWHPVARAGYMEKHGGDYFIRPAKELMGTQHYRVRETIALKANPNLKPMAIQKENGKWAPNRDYRWLRAPVWFIPTAPVSHLPESPTFFADVTEISFDKNKPAGSGWEQGWFIAGGWVPSPKGGKGKHRHWIIGPGVEDNKLLISVSDDDRELYEELTGGLTQAVDRNRMSVIPTREGDSLPCFYTFWGEDPKQQRIAFGHTGMFRLPYQQSPGDMLPKELKDFKGYDLAEAMFGFVAPSKDGGEAVAGRVFVTDARLAGNAADALLPVMEFSDQALSGPKPTTIQHYLTQGDPDHPENLKHFDSDPNADTVLRGHKFYWHVGAAEAFNKRLARRPQIRPNDKLNRFRPVKTGQYFTFDIHFENLHPEELGALLWVMEKAADPNYRLKLGMGKPYGFGSIALTGQVQLTDRAKRYGDLFADDNWNEGVLLEKQEQEKIQDARERFNHFILGDKLINANQATQIDDLPRIRELLALLTWNGMPAEEQTRYMELDEFTGRKHIYPGLQGRPSRRPVLPSATKVSNNKWFAGLPEEEPRQFSRGNSFRSETPRGKTEASIPVPPRKTISVPPRVTPPPQARQRQPEESLPDPVNKAPADIQPGDIILATADDNYSDHELVVLTLEQGGDDDFAQIPANRHPLRRYRKGQQVLLRVIECKGSKKEGYEIVCEPAKP